MHLVLLHEVGPGRGQAGLRRHRTLQPLQPPLPDLRDRLGAFGEIGQQGGVLTATETKVLQAVAKASVRTGLPVFTWLGVAGGLQPRASPRPFR